MSFLNTILRGEEPLSQGLKEETKRELARLRKTGSFTYTVRSVVPREFAGFEYDSHSSDGSGEVQVFRKIDCDLLYYFILFRTSKSGRGFSVELAASVLPYFPFYDFGPLGARFGRRIRLGRLFAGCDYWWHWGRDTDRIPVVLADALIKLQSYAPRFFRKAGERLLSDGDSVQLARSARRWVQQWRSTEGLLEGDSGRMIAGSALAAGIEEFLKSFTIFGELHPSQRRFYRFILGELLRPKEKPTKEQMEAAFHFAGLLMITEAV